MKRPVKCGCIVRRMKKYMEEALKEAQIAAIQGEVPVGAVIEKDGRIIGRGHNRTEQDNDPTAHAEMIAIRQAAREVGWARLTGCNMYVTLEPCPMCAGAIVWARIENLHIGAMDPKAGACGSVMNIVENESLNHRVCVSDGLMARECSKTLKDFFSERRNAKKQKKGE